MAGRRDDTADKKTTATGVSHGEFRQNRLLFRNRRRPLLETRFVSVCFAKRARSPRRLCASCGVGGSAAACGLREKKKKTLHQHLLSSDQLT